MEQTIMFFGFTGAIYLVYKSFDKLFLRTDVPQFKLFMGYGDDKIITTGIIGQDYHYSKGPTNNLQTLNINSSSFIVSKPVFDYEQKNYRKV